VQLPRLRHELSGPLDNPFLDRKPEQFYSLLHAVGEHKGVLPEPDPKSSAYDWRKPELDSASGLPYRSMLDWNLVLASAWQKEPRDKSAAEALREISRQWTKFLNPNQDGDAWMLFACLKRVLPAESEGDRVLVAKASSRLMKLVAKYYDERFPDVDPLFSEDAEKIYKEFLAPALKSLEPCVAVHGGDRCEDLVSFYG